MEERGGEEDGGGEEGEQGRGGDGGEEGELEEAEEGTMAHHGSFFCLLMAWGWNLAFQPHHLGYCGSGLEGVVGVELWSQGPLVVVLVEEQPLRRELFFVFVL